MTLTPGTTLGRYQILEPLGTGGMATVYKAYEPSLERVVALKVIRPGLAGELDFVARFRREAHAVARLAHPNIVQIFGFDEIDGLLFLAMQYLEGGTLKDRLAALAPDERLGWSEVASIVSQVAEALSCAHELGIVHRDMKPSNIMLTRNRAIVTDFGIAKIVAAEQLTETGVGIGTPEYMAPEQGAGAHVDARADVYALGVVAYELLCGRVPFRADTPFAVVAAHMRDAVPLPRALVPQLPRAAEHVLLKALAKDPKQRFTTAPELASALIRAFAGRATLPTVAPRLAANGSHGDGARVRAATGPAAIHLEGAAAESGMTNPTAQSKTRATSPRSDTHIAQRRPSRSSAQRRPQSGAEPPPVFGTTASARKRGAQVGLLAAILAGGAVLGVLALVTRATFASPFSAVSATTEAPSVAPPSRTLAPSGTPTPVPTRTAQPLPSSKIAAATVREGISLSMVGLDPRQSVASGPIIGLSFALSNTTGTPFLVRFDYSEITLLDDTGRAYNSGYGGLSFEYSERGETSFTVAPGETKLLTQFFQGTIPPRATKMTVGFGLISASGPFTFVWPLL